MVYTANDLLNWKDFPKGLRVLLLLDQEEEEENTDSTSQIRSKLEEMDYIVTTFFNEDEAFSAISNQTEIFHVAIVEVTVGNSHGRLKFLEVAKDLPTIMTSSSHCLNTMMKCIALGAVEFLQKPLSEDKLRNIWQHVAHKAFNAGKEETTPESEAVLHLRLVEEDSDQTTQLEPTPSTTAKEDKYPAPSTPQLKQTGRFLDDGDYHDQTHEKEGDGESKSVDTTMTETEPETEHKTTTDNDTLKEEGEPPDELGGDQEADKISALCPPPPPRSNKLSKKKTKIDWTSDLHKKFVKAVEQLGVDQAIPSRILELMRVEGLTRHNIASHLQKYRMHRRHILPKDDINTRKWHHHPNHHNIKDPSSSFQRNHQSVKPVVAYPLYHPHSIYHHPNWASPNGYSTNTAAPMWGSPAGYYPPPWQHQPTPYPGVHADAWGCPIGPTSHGQYPVVPQIGMGFRSNNAMNGCYIVPKKVADFFPTDEIIDQVMEEAINKPWLPLPIGLNPPSTESVLMELSKQGISGVAPPHHIKRRR
ncbi:two-component response regulator-like APRR2 [Impatiens glandulifera]|uniref:two-component response regulator-like APRR2 n=1 Tax=Impatiens glandulifera TaxID=253017 RepID=UPI001FB0CE84|nr:two-component response regulator-like APRR2 [Impatiens glandulifera]